MKFDEVWERLCTRLPWRKYSDMADSVGVSAQSISGAKTRGTFPVDWAFKIAQAYGLSTDWILTGREPSGGLCPSIDEDFLIRVAMVVESVLSERKIEIGSLWQKLRLYSFIYDQCLPSKRIDPEMLQRIISLAAPSAFVMDQDQAVIGLIERLAQVEAKDDLDKVRLRDEWWVRISEKFQAPGLLVPVREKEKVLAWLEEELQRRKAEKEKKTGEGKKNSDWF